jgi:hypothetical protein
MHSQLGCAHLFTSAMTSHLAATLRASTTDHNIRFMKKKVGGILLGATRAFLLTWLGDPDGEVFRIRLLLSLQALSRLNTLDAAEARNGPGEMACGQDPIATGRRPQYLVVISLATERDVAADV